MNAQILITVTGPYQIDLVQTLSEKTHALGGKWLSSKINHIDGYMAGLIKVELDPNKVEVLLNDFKSLPISVEYVELQLAPKEKPNHLTLSIDAKDRHGLVRDISQVLSENSVKVENMECNRIALPDIGGTLFTSHFQIAVADGFDQDMLVVSLQEIPDDLIIDIKID